MNNNVNLSLDPVSQLVTVEDETPTISVLWDKAVQEAIINSKLGPTISSRAYGILHTAIYDAWSAYEGIPIGTQLEDTLQRPQSENTEVNKIEAISYAAYTVLLDLFPSQEIIFRDLMLQLGFNPDYISLDTSTPAGIGHLTATALLEYRHQDGSNQLNQYADTSNYQPINHDGKTVDIEHWTPEYVPLDALPEQPVTLQTCLTPHWGNVTGFALESGNQFQPVAPEPFLLVENAVVDLEQKTITLADGTILEISQDLIGTIINPEFIAQAEEVVNYSANLTDEQKLIAEFWEDASGTAFPPGTWMTFGQYISARDNHSLDEDVRLFFALGNAVFDAGIATWSAKVFYDYTRPVRAIRELGKLGLIGEFNPELGGYTVEAWQPFQGTQTILAEKFITYQTPGSHVSPPFAEYTSGHSAFSAAGAEVLRELTGSDDFGASITFQSGESRFEPNFTPQQPITLEWETFSQAADEAGISRLYGGIHFSDGDINGRNLGKEIGKYVLDQTDFWLNGGFSEPLVTADYYRLQSNYYSTGDYLFVGKEERDLILANPDYNQNFELEGNGDSCFTVAVKPREDLEGFYRLRHQDVMGCYLFVGEAEYQQIFSEAETNPNPWIREGLNEEGIDQPDFYAYPAGSNKGELFHRWRNLENGGYLLAGTSETEAILHNPALASIFNYEGPVFEAII